MTATSMLHPCYPRGRKSTSIPEHPFYMHFGCNMDVGRGVGKWRNIQFTSILTWENGCKKDVGRGSGSGRPLHIHFRTAPESNSNPASIPQPPHQRVKGGGGTLWPRLTSQASHSSSLPATSYHVCGLMRPEQTAGCIIHVR